MGAALRFKVKWSHRQAGQPLSGPALAWVSVSPEHHFPWGLRSPRPLNTPKSSLCPDGPQWAHSSRRHPNAGAHVTPSRHTWTGALNSGNCFLGALRAAVGVPASPQAHGTRPDVWLCGSRHGSALATLWRALCAQAHAPRTQAQRKGAARRRPHAVLYWSRPPARHRPNHSGTPPRRGSRLSLCCWASRSCSRVWSSTEPPSGFSLLSGNRSGNVKVCPCACGGEAESSGAPGLAEAAALQEPRPEPPAPWPQQGPCLQERPLGRPGDWYGDNHCAVTLRTAILLLGGGLRAAWARGGRKRARECLVRWPRVHPRALRTVSHVREHPPPGSESASLVDHTRSSPPAGLAFRSMASLSLTKGSEHAHGHQVAGTPRLRAGVPAHPPAWRRVDSKIRTGGEGAPDRQACIWGILMREIRSGCWVLADPRAVKKSGRGQAAKYADTAPRAPRECSVYTFGSCGARCRPGVRRSSRAALSSQPAGGLSYTFQNFFSPFSKIPKGNSLHAGLAAQNGGGGRVFNISR